MSIERQLNIDFWGQEKKPEPEEDKEEESVEIDAATVEKIVASINRPAPRKFIKKSEEPLPSPKSENISSSREIEYPDPYGDIYPLSRHLRRPRK